MKKLITLIFATAFLFQSCGNDRLKRAKESVQQTTKVAEKDSIEEFHEEFDYAEADKLYAYPKTANKAEDFLPKIGIYEIQYEANGDLNKDGLDDIAIVLVQKEVKTDERPMLILIQNKDKSYRLDKVSNLVMPIEYTDSNYKIYDKEDVNIENGMLNIRLYGTGPSGNVFSDFKYFGNDLMLTYIETYNVGAGSWHQLYYIIEKGELTEVITNTMEESMPTKKKTFKLTKEKYEFESASPDDIIIEAYKKIDSEW